MVDWGDCPTTRISARSFQRTPNIFIHQNSLYGIVKIPLKDCAKCIKLFRISLELSHTFASVSTSDSNEICWVLTWALAPRLATRRGSRCLKGRPPGRCQIAGVCPQSGSWDSISSPSTSFSVSWLMMWVYSSEAYFLPCWLNTNQMLRHQASWLQTRSSRTLPWVNLSL